MKRECLITYKIQTDNALYQVILEKLKNTKYGNPRFKAILTKIIDYKYHNICNEQDNGYYISYSYKFTGHCYNDYDEVIWLIKEHEREEQED